MIYISCFAMSILFASLAQKADVKNNKILVVFLSLISILILAVIGGCRDYSIGTDINVYLRRDFLLAKRCSDFFQYMNLAENTEPLYLLLVYTFAQLKLDMHWLLFAIQFIITSCVYMGAYKYRKNTSMELILLIYCCLFYNETFNLMRQHLAMSVVFLGINNIEKKRYIAFVGYVFIAVLFHSSAFIAVSLLAVHLFSSAGNKRYRTLKEIIFVILIIVICLFPMSLFNTLANIGVLPAKYRYYFENNSVSNSYTLTSIYVVELIVILSAGKRLEAVTKNADYYILNLFVLIATLQLSRVLYYGSRISAYYGIANIIAMADIQKIRLDKTYKVFSTIILIFILLFYWWYVFIYGGSSETYPYTSSILGIGY